MSDSLIEALEPRRLLSVGPSLAAGPANAPLPAPAFHLSAAPLSNGGLTNAPILVTLRNQATLADTNSKVLLATSQSPADLRAQATVDEKLGARLGLAAKVELHIAALEHMKILAFQALLDRLTQDANANPQFANAIADISADIKALTQAENQERSAAEADKDLANALVAASSALEQRAADLESPVPT